MEGAAATGAAVAADLEKLILTNKKITASTVLT
jgi:hypothetical protein